MYYAVTHLTLYKYSHAITDSVMEVRMHPRSDGHQRCLRFNLEVAPKSKVFSYRDYLGNTINTFNVPGAHERLAVKAEAVVEVREQPPLPDALPEDSWLAVDAHAAQDREAGGVVGFHGLAELRLAAAVGVGHAVVSGVGG